MKLFNMKTKELGVGYKITLLLGTLAAFLLSLYLGYQGVNMTQAAPMSTLWGILTVLAYVLLGFVLALLALFSAWGAIKIYFAGDRDEEWWQPLVTFLTWDVIATAGIPVLWWIANQMSKYSFGDGLVNTLLWLTIFVPIGIMLYVVMKVAEPVLA